MATVEVRSQTVPRCMERATVPHTSEGWPKLWCDQVEGHAGQHRAWGHGQQMFNLLYRWPMVTVSIKFEQGALPSMDRDAEIVMDRPLGVPPLPARNGMVLRKEVERGRFVQFTADAEDLCPRGGTYIGAEAGDACGRWRGGAYVARCGTCGARVTVTEKAPEALRFQFHEHGVHEVLYRKTMPRWAK